MARRQSITIGDMFGRLTVIGEAEPYTQPSNGKRKRQWLVRCGCGTEKVVIDAKLKSGHTKSCGCLRNDVFMQMVTTHGKSRTPEYTSWYAMKQRCTNPKNKQYADYGGRGITMCLRWHLDPAAFLSDMGPKPSPDHSIDRIDNNLGYWCGHPSCPECGPRRNPPNCWWADEETQQNNKRSSIRITMDNECRTAAQWSKKNGIKKGTIYSRMRRGWSAERSVSVLPEEDAPA